MAANPNGRNGPRARSRTGRNRNSLRNLASKQSRIPTALDRPRTASGGGALDTRVLSEPPQMTQAQGTKPETQRTNRTLPTRQPISTGQADFTGATGSLNQSTSFINQLITSLPRGGGGKATKLRNAVRNGNWQDVVPDQYEKFVRRAAARYDINPGLLAAVGQIESGWRTGAATSSAGARGPLQTMPFWSDASNDPYGSFDPNRNPGRGIMLGAAILRGYLNQAGGRRRGLAYYNAGPGNWEAGTDYAQLVLNALKQIRRG